MRPCQLFQPILHIGEVLGQNVVKVILIQHDHVVQALPTYRADQSFDVRIAGVAWCFGKHDRPWIQRPIFGTVRYMNAAGLERKFDMPAYLRMVDGFPLL
jgi:hypothetical protein